LTPKPLLIYNPAAAKGRAGKILPHVLALLAQRGFDCDLKLTERPGHALELGRQAVSEGRSLVIAAGGDGTVNETINGVMEGEVNGGGRPALGVLPIGRGNDFAFGAGIPLGLEQACDVLVSGSRRRMDIGRVSGGDYPAGRFFGNGVGLGFDTVVGFEAAKLPWLTGAASYLVAVVRTLFLYAHAPVYEVTLDDQTLRQPFLMVSVMNGRRMGGSFMMAPEGDPHDGIFNLCLVGEVSQLRILPLAATIMQGKQEGKPAIRMTRSRRVHIRAIDGSIPAHADGETVCTAGEELAIELLPGALEVVVLAAVEQPS
jgi:diacylglycerol kinase (ATP)